MPSQPRRPYFAAALLCLAGFALAPLSHAAEPAAPGQVIGYAKADRSGPAQAWDLPPDKSYLYVPSLPAHMGGRIAAVETGAEIGVVLFHEPYFTSRDQACQPPLGTARRPDLTWLGATARFVPAPEAQAEVPTAPEGYGSLILYRTDLGPPPGALLLDRRATVGLRCANPAYNTVYNRIFVPVAEAPEAVRCFDLVGDHPGATGTVALDFVRSDRLVLLSPRDMDQRYDSIRHDITVSLFDGLSCSGSSVNLTSRAARHRDSRLSDLGFRDRGRSIRLTYDYGNADAFLVRRPAPASPALAAVPPKAPKPDLAMEPIGDPSIGPAPSQAKAAPQTAPGPASEAKPMTMPEAEPEAKSQVAPAAASAAMAASLAAAAPKAAPEPAPQANPQPAPAQALALAPTPAPAPPPAPTPAPNPVAAPKPAPEPASAPAMAPSPPVGGAPGQAVAALPPTRTAVPKLNPVLERPMARVAVLPSTARTFAFPVHEIYRLNLCLRSDRECGEPAAEAWCRARGYERAVDWAADPDIGADFPTVVLAERRVCAESTCDGFKTITCAP